jgi:hypothetical protein
MRRTAIRRIPQPIQPKRLVVNAFRIRENSSGRARASRNQEITGSRAVSSTPLEAGIRSAIRMAHRWIAAAKRTQMPHPTR